MRTTPVICFAMAAAIAGSMMPMPSSHAEDYPTQAQNCGSTAPLPTEGVGNCKVNKESHEKETRTHTPRSN